MAHTPVAKPAPPAIDRRSRDTDAQPEIDAYCASPFGVMVMLRIVLAVDALRLNARKILSFGRNASRPTRPGQK